MTDSTGEVATPDESLRLALTLFAMQKYAHLPENEMWLSVLAEGLAASGKDALAKRVRNVLNNLATAEHERKDLSVLVRRMLRRLRGLGESKTLCDQAERYLQQIGLNGDILREGT